MSGAVRPYYLSGRSNTLLDQLGNHQTHICERLWVESQDVHSVNIIEIALCRYNKLLSVMKPPFQTALLHGGAG